MEFYQKNICKDNFTKFDLVIGGVLGDAHISKDGDIQIWHSEKQKEYSLWLMDLYKKYFNVRYKERISHCGWSDETFNMVGFRTSVSKYLKLARKVFYRPTKTITRRFLDKLSPVGLAIWYMDDGNLSFIKKNGLIKGRQITLATHDFTYNEQVIIQSYFKDVWDITCHIHKDRDQYRIWMNGTESKKFLSIILPYMPECMYYKVCYKYFGYKSGENLCKHPCTPGDCPYNIV